MAKELTIMTINVVTFIPPAVEPGAPPISINTIWMNFPVSLSLVRSTELKPAVLGETAWKKEAKIRDSIGISLNSKKKKYRVGSMIRNAVAIRIIFDCTEYLWM